MKIVVLDGGLIAGGDLSWNRLEALGSATIYDRTGEGLEAERASGAEIVLTSKTPLSEATLQQLPETRYIGVLSTGYN
ncbi:MAG: D-2-hydroxyacid dehydrogenase, partial [Pseudomonadota bacterium]